MRFQAPNSLLAVVTVALTSLALVACGSDDNDDDSGSAGPKTSTGAADKAPAAAGGGEKLTLDAVEGGPTPFAFSPKSLTAKSGSVTVTMANPAGNKAPHAIEVEGNGVEEVGETVQAGGSSTVTADLKPGKYEFYCPVGDHQEEGMEGTLTVR